MSYFDLGMDKNLVVPYAEYLKAIKPDFAYIGDTSEIVDVVRCLYLPSANSVKLVGPRGSGVTVLMDALVHHQTSKFMPDDFMIRPIFRFNANNLFSTSDTSAIEKRFNDAMENLQRQYRQRKTKPIVVIDDGTTFVDNAPQHVINGLIEAAVRADYIDIIIGVDKKHEENLNAAHPEFRDSFTTKEVSEPQKDQVLQILRHHADKHLKQGVALSDKALLHAYDITDRFKSMYETAQPNRVIRLLDSAATAFRIRIHSSAPGAYEKEEELHSVETQARFEGFEPDSPENPYRVKIDTLKDELAKIKSGWDDHRHAIRAIQDDIRKFEVLIATAEREIEVIDAQTKDTFFRDLRDTYKDQPEGDPVFKGSEKTRVLNFDRDQMLEFAEFDLVVHRNPKIKTLNDDISKYSAAIQYKQQELLTLGDVDHKAVHMPTTFIDDEATKVTKTPVGGISGRLRENLLQGVPLMKEAVFGQDHVIEPIVKSLQRAAAGLNDPNRPLGVFMIAGPPGVGKTWLAKQLAVKLFGSMDYYVELNMNDYAAEHNVASLFGAPPGYAGHGKKGRLIQIGQEKPFSVLCLDEIEKAHYEVRQALLTVMSAGRAVGQDGEEADFRNIIIISTSNFGNGTGIWNGDFASGVELFQNLIRSSGDVFSPEYIDRHDGLLCAGPLDRHALSSIVKRAINSLETNAKRNNPEFSIKTDDNSIESFVDDHCFGMSGRRAERLINQMIGDRVVDIILSQERVSGELLSTYDKLEKVFKFQFS